MALIPKVEPKQEKKPVSVRLDEESHAMLLRYAAFLGGATHEYIVCESLKRLFRRDKEFQEWLAKNEPTPPAKQAPIAPTPQTTRPATKPVASAT